MVFFLVADNRARFAVFILDKNLVVCTPKGTHDSGFQNQIFRRAERNTRRQTIGQGNSPLCICAVDVDNINSIAVGINASVQFLFYFGAVHCAQGPFFGPLGAVNKGEVSPPTYARTADFVLGIGASVQGAQVKIRVLGKTDYHCFQAHSHGKFVIGFYGNRWGKGKSFQFYFIG